MDIDVLINLLSAAKADEIKKVQIIVKSNDESNFYSEDITGISYNFENDSVILFPRYL